MDCGCSAGLSLSGGGRSSSHSLVPSKKALYEHAKALGIKGRSTMNKNELANAIKRAMKSKSKKK